MVGQRADRRCALSGNVPPPVEEPDAFWREEAQRIDWIKPFTRVKETSFHEADFGIKWFADGTLNLSANCLDRHLAERGDAIAILWEPDSPRGCRTPHHLSRAARGRLPLRQPPARQGREEGERVTIYLPMVPEAAVAMLACARIGAIHSIVFAGFRPTRSPAASSTATAASSSPPTKGCAAARRCRSRPTSMRRSSSAPASIP
jgi:hypothetical protein